MTDRAIDKSGSGALTVGSRLRQAREAKGWSLEQVSRSTKIHLNVLTAIEADRASETINPVYLKGFLKTYARHLGEDETALLSALPNTNTSPLPRPAPSTPRPAATARAPVADAVGLIGSGLRRVPWRALGLVVTVFVVLGTGVRWFTSHAHRAPHQPLRAVAASAPTTKTPGRAATKKKTAPVAAVIKPKSPAPKAGAPGAAHDGVRLTVDVRSMTWMQVMADGAVIFQQVLQPGAHETWLAKHEMTLWLGDAGGVSLELNGRMLGVPGKRGEVLRGLRITPEGMQR